MPTKKITLTAVLKSQTNKQYIHLHLQKHQNIKISKYLTAINMIDKLI
jgi:hypothetical protein